MDVFSKSDPICILYTKENSNSNWNKIDQTEKIDNNLNPEFDKFFTLSYFFERQQHLKFEVIDDDGGGKFDMIGSIETTLGHIMGAKH